MKITVTIKCTAETKDEATHKLATEYREFKAWVEEMTLNGAWGLPHENVMLRWMVETGAWDRDGAGGTAFVRPGSASVVPGPVQRAVGPMPPLFSEKESRMTSPQYEFVSGVLEHPGGVAQACAQLQQQGFEVFSIIPVTFQASALSPNMTNGICIVARRPAQAPPAGQTVSDVPPAGAPDSSEPQPEGEPDGNRR